MGQDLRVINSGYHTPGYMCGLWETIASGNIWQGGLKNKAKDGTHYWTYTTILPILNEKGKSSRYITISADISERKKLEEQHALFASIVNASDDAILSKNLDGIITIWNPAAEKIFGYPAKEMIGSHISILIPTYLLHEEKEIMEKISRDEFVEHYETKWIRRDGKLIDVTMTISPVKDQLGNIIGDCKISRDITHRKASENKLLKVSRLYAFISAINKSIVHIK